MSLLHLRHLAAAAAVVLVACARPPAVSDPVQRQFWNEFRDLCGQAFAGRVVEAGETDRAALTDALVLEVWQCYPQELRLAFHVGDDHSRVWVLSPSAAGIRLGHSLHSSDGEPLDYSGYGGETANIGTGQRQIFVPDGETLANVPTARGSEWLLEIVPGERISYSLVSPASPPFRVDFDLTQPVDRQPPPWGYTRMSAPSRPDGR